MPKTSSRRLRNYERQDFNALLGELKKEKPAEADFQVKTEEKKQPSETAGQKPEKQVFSLYRQRIFSNENVRREGKKIYYPIYMVGFLNRENSLPPQIYKPDFSILTE